MPVFAGREDDVPSAPWRPVDRRRGWRLSVDRTTARRAATPLDGARCGSRPPWLPSAWWHSIHCQS